MAIHVAGILMIATYGGRIVSPPAPRFKKVLLAPVLTSDPVPPRLAKRKILIQPPPVRRSEVTTPAMVLPPAPEIAKAELPRPKQPIPVQIEVQPPPPPKPVARIDVFESQRSAPAIPKAVVQSATGAFASSNANAAKAQPPRGVVTGAFSDTASAATGPQKARLVVEARAGFADTTGGQLAARAARVQVQSGGVFGDTTPGTAGKSRPTSVTEGAFGVVARESGTLPSRVEVARSGFGDVVKAAAPNQIVNAPVAAASSPVEILQKPRPKYTEEARRLQLEGDVVIKVVFAASGELQVMGIVQGLGHGLDESAVVAARAIKFRPAVSVGVPVDTTANVRIRFELAY